MASVEITFKVRNETKGTARFEEVLEPGDLEPVVGTLYVKKPAWVRLGSPDVVTVTVTA